MAISTSKSSAATAPARSAARPATSTQAKPRAAATAVVVASGFVSLNPDTFTSGGLIDDIDVEITDCLACEYDYNGNGPLGPSLAVEFTDVNGAAYIQYYSAGKADDWKAHESGEGFVAVSGKTGFNLSTNIGMLIDSMVKAGFPKEQLDGNVKRFIGTKCHVLQTQTERKGLIRTGVNKDRPSTVLLVTKIHSLPDSAQVGGQAAVLAKPNGAAHPAAAAAPAAGDSDSLDTLLHGYLLSALAESPVIEKKEIVKIIFQQCTADGKTPADRNKAVIRSGQQDFLKGLGEVGIEYTGTEITLGG